MWLPCSCPKRGKILHKLTFMTAADLDLEGAGEYIREVHDIQVTEAIRTTEERVIQKSGLA